MKTKYKVGEDIYYKTATNNIGQSTITAILQEEGKPVKYGIKAPEWAKKHLKDTDKLYIFEHEIYEDRESLIENI